MATHKLSVLIFGSCDDLDLGWVRAVGLKRELDRVSGYPARLIDKRGFNLDELKLVARHKIVSTPTVLIFDNDHVIYRRLSLPTAQAICEVLASRQETTGGALAH